MAEIWVWVETFKGKVANVSYEALAEARRLAERLGGGRVTALVFGESATEIAAALGARGADRVLACADATLADFRIEPFAALIVKLAQEGQPDMLLAGTTVRGRDVFAAAAADLAAPLIADVTALDVVDGRVRATRPVYAGKLLAELEAADKRPLMLTLRSRAFPAGEPEAGRVVAVEQVGPALAEDQIASKVKQWVLEAEGQVSLTDASVIVSGGRAVANNNLQPPAGLDAKAQEIWKAQQGFKLVGELAAVLGGAMGASRAAVDAGYIPYAHQVGQTGKTVSPNLYIACGISGAIQHLAGMRTSKNILAINKDPEAPIFKVAQYGVVGDIFKILPALTAELKKRLGK